MFCSRVWFPTCDFKSSFSTIQRHGRTRCKDGKMDLETGWPPLGTFESLFNSNRTNKREPCQAVDGSRDPHNTSSPEREPVASVAWPGNHQRKWCKSKVLGTTTAGTPPNLFLHLALVIKWGWRLMGKKPGEPPRLWSARRLHHAPSLWRQSKATLQAAPHPTSESRAGFASEDGFSSARIPTGASWTGLWRHPEHSHWNPQYPWVLGSSCHQVWEGC